MLDHQLLRNLLLQVWLALCNFDVQVLRLDQCRRTQHFFSYLSDITTAPDLVQSCVKQKEKRSELHLPAVIRAPQCVFNFKGVLTEHFRVIIFLLLTT